MSFCSCSPDKAVMRRSSKYGTIVIAGSLSGAVLLADILIDYFKASEIKMTVLNSIGMNSKNCSLGIMECSWACIWDNQNSRLDCSSFMIQPRLLTTPGCTRCPSLAVPLAIKRRSVKYGIIAKANSKNLWENPKKGEPCPENDVPLFYLHCQMQEVLRAFPNWGMQVGIL